MIFKMIRIRIYLSDSICLLGITFFLSSNVEQATTFGSTIRATHVDQCSITSLALLSRMPSPFSDSGMAVGRTRDEPAQGIRVAYVCSSTYCNASMNSSTVTSPFTTSTPSSVIIQSGSRHDRKVGHPAYRECGDEDRDVRRHTCQSRPYRQRQEQDAQIQLWKGGFCGKGARLADPLRNIRGEHGFIAIRCKKRRRD